MTIHPLTEKVARRIAVESGQEDWWEDYIDEANAAIRAVLTFEPTPGMKLVGSLKKNAHRAPGVQGNFRAGVPDIYCAMAAALLKEVENDSEN